MTLNRKLTLTLTLNPDLNCTLKPILSVYLRKSVTLTLALAGELWVFSISSSGILSTHSLPTN